MLILTAYLKNSTLRFIHPHYAHDKEEKTAPDSRFTISELDPIPVPCWNNVGMPDIGAGSAYQDSVRPNPHTKTRFGAHTV